MDTLSLNILKVLVTNKKLALEFAYECDEKLIDASCYAFAHLILPYIRQFKECPTLRVMLNSVKENQKPLIEKFFTLLDSHKYDEREFKYDLTVLKRRFAKQQLLSLKKRLEDVDDTSTNDKIEKEVKEFTSTLSIIKNIDEKKPYIQKSVKEYMPDFLVELSEKNKNPQKYEDSKIKTGLAVFDMATNGGINRDGDYVIVAGESGTGKSIYLNTIAVNMFLNGNTIDMTEFPNKGNNIVFFSLEMPFYNAFNRFLAALSDVEYFHLESGKVTKEEVARLRKAKIFLENYPYHFDIIDYPKKMTCDEMELILDGIFEQHDVDVIVCDYINIMQVNNAQADMQDWLAQNEISREFRDVLRVFKRSGITAVQLNRVNSKDADSAIGLHRLARSNLIASHATQIIQLVYRGDKEEFQPDSQYVFIKNRNGLKSKGVTTKAFNYSKVVNDPNDPSIKLLKDYASIKDFDMEDVSDQFEQISLDDLDL